MVQQANATLPLRYASAHLMSDSNYSVIIFAVPNRVVHPHYHARKLLWSRAVQSRNGRWERHLGPDFCICDGRGLLEYLRRQIAN